MKIVVTGASGLIGSALVPSLAAQGHEIVKLKRTHHHDSAPSWDPDAGQISLAAAAPFDAVIHLAGETIAQRWTAAAKSRIRDSRVKGTSLLCKGFVDLPHAPKLLICASATGYYGDRGEEFLDEQSAPGLGFLAEVCRDWEDATRPAAAHGIRVVNLRFGIVLTPQGGALGKMLPIFRLGLGGKLGHGRQYLSWVVIDDLLAIIHYVLTRDNRAGPVNVVSPHPITNAEFTHTLGAVLRRPTVLCVPAFALKLLAGEMADTALLASARVRPARLEQAGFEFHFPKLQEALRHLLRAVVP